MELHGTARGKTLLVGPDVSVMQALEDSVQEKAELSTRETQVQVLQENLQI